MPPYYSNVKISKKIVRLFSMFSFLSDILFLNILYFMNVSPPKKRWGFSHSSWYFFTRLFYIYAFSYNADMLLLYGVCDTSFIFNIFNKHFHTKLLISIIFFFLYLITFLMFLYIYLLSICNLRFLYNNDTNIYCHDILFDTLLTIYLYYTCLFLIFFFKEKKCETI